MVDSTMQKVEGKLPVWQDQFPIPAIVGCVARFSQKSVSKSHGSKVMSGFQLFPMSKDVLPCIFAICAFGGDARVSEESRIDDIVDVAWVNDSKQGSPGEMMAPDRSSATRTHKSWIILDFILVGVLVPLRRRRASEITPAAGRPKWAT
jgi:hypothetical protein